jgi:hypothetical protein
VSRIFQSGFESGTYISEFWAGGDGTYLSFVTSPIHCGNYAARFAGRGFLLGTLNPGVNAAYLRWYHLIDSTSIGAASRIGALQSASGMLAALRLRTDRQLELIQDYTVSMTLSGFQIPINQWVCLELFVDVTNQLVCARYQGQVWANRSTAGNFAYAGPITTCLVGPDESTTSGCSQYYDDVAVNSTAGRVNCFWPGLVVGSRNYPPTGDAETGWSATTGTPHYQQVDEASPDTSTYVSETAFVNGAAEGFYIDLDLDWPISAVMVGCHVLSWAGTTAVQFRAQWNDPSNSIAIMGASVDPSLAWVTRYPVLTMEEAWDGSRRVLNSGYLRRGYSRLIFVRLGAGDRNIALSTVWIVVEYAMPFTAQPVPHPYPPQPQILVELEP